MTTQQLSTSSMNLAFGPEGHFQQGLCPSRILERRPGLQKCSFSGKHSVYSAKYAANQPIQTVSKGKERVLQTAPISYFALLSDCLGFRVTILVL